MPRYVPSAPPAPVAPPSKPPRNSRRKKIFSLMAAVVILTAYGARFGLWGGRGKTVQRTTTTVVTTQPGITVFPPSTLPRAVAVPPTTRSR